MSKPENQRKRRFNPNLDEIPAVERLYREQLPSFSTAGGFLAEEAEDLEKKKSSSVARQKYLDSLPRPEAENCEKCDKSLMDSWLWEKFALPVCDACKDGEGEHRLMSRSDVMKEFLLKPEDLDIRGPPLRFLSKKNPHNPRYGDMKLYVYSQAVARMLMVHNSWEALAEKKENREEEKEKRQNSVFDKKVKEMRRNMRDASGRKAKTIAVHEHEFGEEEHLGGDEYGRKCTTCEYQLKYEKM